MTNTNQTLSPAQLTNQLSQVLDLSCASHPAIIFFIGSGGSGKSTTAIAFRDTMNRQDLIAVRFDDANKDFNVPRWSDRLAEYPDRESCIHDHVSNWIDSVVKANGHRKLIICDVNTDPDTLLAVMTKHPEIPFRIALVQPSHEVWCSRLANDESRKYMPPEELSAQFDSKYPDFLARRSDELGIPRFLNEDTQKTTMEIASLALKLF